MSTPVQHPRRNARIEALSAGGMSFGQIAQHLGLTRCLVAGVVWRADRRARKARPDFVAGRSGVRRARP